MPVSSGKGKSGLCGQIKACFSAFVCTQSLLKGRAEPAGELSFPLLSAGRQAGSSRQGAHTQSVYKCALVRRSRAAFSAGDRKNRQGEWCI